MTKIQPKKGTAPKKPVKAAPPRKPMTAAQHRAFLHFVRTHPFKQVVTKSKIKTPRGAVRPVSPPGTDNGDWSPKTYWILGKNNIKDTCVLTAIANTLLLDKRSRTLDSEILAGGENLSVMAGLKYIEDYGLNGWELASFMQVVPDNRVIAMPGTVLGVYLPELGSHAVTTLGGGDVISWGHIMKLPAHTIIDEAWRISWKQKVVR